MGQCMCSNSKIKQWDYGCMTSHKVNQKEAMSLLIDMEIYLRAFKMHNMQLNSANLSITSLIGHP